MDSTTFFLIIIILVAIVLIAVGVYLILVLHEARITLRRLNNILDHADSIIEILDEKIARPASSLLGVFGVVKEVLEMFQDFRRGRKEPHGGGHEPKSE
jgi:signal transduction histidine kinase